MINRRIFAATGLLSLLPWRKAKAVTATQMQSAAPIYQALSAVNATLAELTAASGNNSILGFAVTLGDANENGVGQIVMNVPLNPTQAAPMFQAMVGQLTTLQAALTAEMSAI